MDRLEIVKSLTRHMTLADDVILGDLADSCEYFTGADFKALLYNAQLNAIHEQYGLDFGGSGAITTPIASHTATGGGGATTDSESCESDDGKLDGNGSYVHSRSTGNGHYGVTPTRQAKTSDSENSGTSSSSWEAVSSPSRGQCLS